MMLGAAAPGGERGTSSGCGCVLKPEALQLVLAEALSQNVFSSMYYSPSLPPPLPLTFLPFLPSLPFLYPTHLTMLFAHDITPLICLLATRRLLSTSGELISCAGERAGEDLVSAIVASVWKTVCHHPSSLPASLARPTVNCTLVDVEIAVATMRAPYLI